MKTEKLVKYILLVPEKYNDGSRVEKKVINEIKNDIYDLAGGLTEAGKVNGMFKMANGKKCVEKLSQLWIIITEEKELELKRLVRDFGQKLAQEKLLLTKTTDVVELV